MGRLTGLSIKNQFSTDPTEKHIEKWLLSVLRQFYTKISPDLFKIQPDLIEIFQDLFKIRPNLIEIRSDPAKTRDFNEIWQRFLQNRNRTIPDEPLTSNHPNRCCRQQVQVQETQSGQVGARLGTNSTRTNPWIGLL